MERKIKDPVQNNAVSSVDKAWVTISQSVHLGNYEIYKIESGYSHTLLPGEDPLEIIDQMQEDIQPIVEYAIQDVRKRLTVKPVRK